MARKKSETSKVKEAMFLGDSKELKGYLVAKRKFFKILIKEDKELSKEQTDKISGYIEAIDEMLEQKYFSGRRVYSMSELIDEIKLERADLQLEMKALKSEVEEAKAKAEGAFRAQKGYLANKYEAVYNSSGQVELRKLIDEYQVLSYHYEGLEKCRKTLWWLLGVIHRPVGFFEKVV